MTKVITSARTLDVIGRRGEIGRIGLLARGEKERKIVAVMPSVMTLGVIDGRGSLLRVARGTEVYHHGGNSMSPTRVTGSSC